MFHSTLRKTIYPWVFHKLWENCSFQNYHKKGWLNIYGRMLQMFGFKICLTWFINLILAPIFRAISASSFHFGLVPKIQIELGGGGGDRLERKVLKVNPAKYTNWTSFVSEGILLVMISTSQIQNLIKINLRKGWYILKGRALYILINLVGKEQSLRSIERD